MYEWIKRLETCFKILDLRLFSKVATVDYFGSRLFRRLVYEILHNIYGDLSLAIKGH